MAAQSIQATFSARPVCPALSQPASQKAGGRLSPHAALISSREHKLTRTAFCRRTVLGATESSYLGQRCVVKPTRKQKEGCQSKQGIRMVTTESETMEVGSRAPEFELLEPLTGKTVSLDDFEGAPGLLVMFICNHCPYVIHLKSAIRALTDEYIQKGLSVVAISSNSVKTHPQDGPEAMAEDAKKLSYDFPYLFDETQEVAKAYKAVCTPEFYVFKKDGRRPFELTYHGRFDETRPRSGQTPTGKDLRNALDCTLSARPVPGPHRPSIGCSIKWHPEE